MERETRLELATPTLARLGAKPRNPARRKEYSVSSAGRNPDSQRAR